MTARTAPTAADLRRVLDRAGYPHDGIPDTELAARVASMPDDLADTLAGALSWIAHGCRPDELGVRETLRFEGAVARVTRGTP